MSPLGYGNPDTGPRYLTKPIWAQICEGLLVCSGKEKSSFPPKHTATTFQDI